MDRRVAASVLVAVFVIVGLASPAIAQASSDAVLILHFDEGSGTIANDASGHGNDGTIYGATWASGISGKALQFDGVDDYISLPTIFVNTPPSISVEGWFKTTSDSHDMMLFSLGGVYAMYMRAYKSDPAGSLLPLFDGSSIGDHSWGSGYNDGRWHHFVAINDGSETKLYVDGIFVNSRPETLADTMSRPSAIGSQYTGDKYRFNGLIDKVCIYNRALTADEIKTHYEGKQAELRLTKTTSPHSIKQDQKTLVKITVENTGTTTIKDIEVVDRLPADFEFVSGDTSAKYGSLKPRESRTFQYTLRSGDTGKFDLGHATATYADEEGNYHTVKSNTPLVEVMAPLEKPEIPTIEEKKGTPGFEAVFAVVGLLVVVYVLRRKK